MKRLIPNIAELLTYDLRVVDYYISRHWRVVPNLCQENRKRSGWQVQVLWRSGWQCRTQNIAPELLIPAFCRGRGYYIKHYIRGVSSTTSTKKTLLSQGSSLFLWWSIRDYPTRLRLIQGWKKENAQVAGYVIFYWKFDLLMFTDPKKMKAHLTKLLSHLKVSSNKYNLIDDIRKQTCGNGNDEQNIYV